MMAGFWYLATPYSKFPGGIEAAWRLACREAGLLIRHGIPTYSPIAHSHAIASVTGMDPGCHDIWLPVDLPLLDASRGVIVLMAPGWQESKGMAMEMDRAWEAGKTIVYMEPGIVPAALLEPKS